MSADTWDPGQYDRFAAERRQPFYDLVDLVRGGRPARVLDLGCGTGALTRILHDRVGAADTLGIDSSPAMLAEAAGWAGDGVRFVAGDIAELDGTPPVDLVFSNAALQWVPDHEAVLGRWSELLGPGGDLAVQVPANVDHPSHRIIDELAGEAPYVDAGAGPPPRDPVWSVLAPEAYAELLHRLGFAEQHVRLQVYGHLLESTEAVVEWTKGTSLTRIKGHLPSALYDDFVEEYRRRFVERVGDQRPYFYAFKRILLWGQR